MKIIKIGIILMVLLSMVGFTSASMPTVPDSMDVNIISNAISNYEISYKPTTANTMAKFKIMIYDVETTSYVPTDDFEASLDGGTNFYSTSPYIAAPSIDGAGVAQWTLSIRDKDNVLDENDTAQMNNIYKVVITCDTDSANHATLNGVAEGLIIPVPEFPTIALPIAAILGIAFIFQRRREEN
ncbi:MAG: PEF-CTERM sorting domain-containing protein [Methanosarcinaceae archaeon]|nr:PEF-CTERM sorting domain-containing protein [Methanosarcinaceae archaeon]